MKLLTVALLASVMSTAMRAWTAGGPQGRPDIPFADDQVRVHSVSIAPGGRADLGARADALIIPLALDLDGRAPAEAVSWQPAGTATLENRSSHRFDAVMVELVAPRSALPASFPPEAAAALTGWPLRSPRAEGHRVRPVLDHPRVLVTEHRLPDWQAPTEAWHWHSRDLVLVYLAGGAIAGSTGHIDARRVRRGEFDVLPANVPHAFQNVGNTPLEFLLIAPK
jgi:mannose-6-phosphate isomerase-like protein (cupin superfamily)